MALSGMKSKSKNKSSYDSSDDHDTTENGRIPQQTIAHTDDNNQSTRLHIPESEDEVEALIVSANTRKLQMRKEFIDRAITQAKESTPGLLDLSRKGLTEVPNNSLECRNLQFLYLEGNELRELPDNFFDCFGNLQWLDLRNNYLKSIPTTYVSSHQCLKNLLLEGNQLRTLPLELGLVTTLNGLNIANNPIEFPPTEIIEKGTQHILAFFREILRAKREGKIPPVPSIQDLQQQMNEDVYSEASDEILTYNHPANFKTHTSKSSKGVHPELPTYNTQASFHAGLEDDLVGPVPQSAALHKPTTYQEIRQQQTSSSHHRKRDKTHKSRSSSKSERKLPREADVYPPPPEPTRIEEKYAEEKRLAKIRNTKEKQDTILQKRKDAEKLRKFRDDSKRMQREKQMEKIRKGGKLDYPDAAEEAPYGVRPEDMAMMTNEERIAQDIKAKHEKIRQRPMSPRSFEKMEQARAERDKELEKKIKQHTQAMQERRQKPKGTPQEEMEAAKKELEVAEHLQRELDRRRQDLEYRFTAFTGDYPTKKRSRPVPN